MAGADATEYVWFAVYVPQNPHTFTVASAPTLTVTGFVCRDSDYFWDSVGRILFVFS